MEPYTTFIDSLQLEVLKVGRIGSGIAGEEIITEVFLVMFIEELGINLEDNFEFLLKGHFLGAFNGINEVFIGKI